MTSGVAALVHINEIDHECRQVAQSYLAHDFLDRVHVGLDDRIFKARRLAYILPVFTSIATSASVWLITM